MIHFCQNATSFHQCGIIRRGILRQKLGITPKNINVISERKLVTQPLLRTQKHDLIYQCSRKFQDGRAQNLSHLSGRRAFKSNNSFALLPITTRPPAYSFRHYSQGGTKNGAIPSSLKWILAVSSTGAACFLIYKLLFVGENQSSDSTANKDELSKESAAVSPVKFPPSSEEIPDNVPYLVIGGGTAAFSAFRAIKAFDSTARVLIVTDEPFFPYMRPPLTKELVYNQNREGAKKYLFTQWNGSERSIFFEPDEFYLPCNELNESKTGGASVARGWKVVQLNPDQKYAVLDDGKRINYNKCLLATGAVPKNLPEFLKSDPAVQKKVTLYRTLNDFIKLENAIENGAKEFAIIGGGSTGSELACSLSRRGVKVFQIFKEESNMYKILPKYLSNWLSNKIEEQGVTLVKNSEVNKAELVGNKVKITTKNNETVLADHVLVAAGAVPNIELASEAFLEVDKELGGYIVNAELQARSDLFAAGDCASFYDQQLGRRRLDHYDHAVTSGRLAGENMTGAGKPFNHQSMFWSDFGPALGYEAIGIVDSSLPTVAIYLENPEQSKDSNVENKVGSNTGYLYNEEPSNDFQKGVVFYLKNDKVVGMVMWNLFNRISIARQVLKSDVKLEDLREVAKLFNLSKTPIE